jgi:oligosaccharide repeat unit polymerase
MVLLMTIAQNKVGREANTAGSIGIACILIAASGGTFIFGNLAAALLLAAIAMMALFWPLLLEALQARKPVAFFVPIFAIYSFSSIYAAHTQTFVLQITLKVAGIFFFILGAAPSWVQPSLPGKPAWPTPPVRLRFGLSWIFVLSSAMLSVYIFSIHGVPILSQSVAIARIEATSNGYLSTIVVTLGQAAMIASFSAASEAGKFKNVLRTSAPGLLALLVLAAYGNRGFYVFPLIAVAAFLILRRPARLRSVAIAAIPLMALVSFAGFQRNLQLFGPTYLQDISATGVPQEVRFLAPLLSYFAGTSQAVDQIVQTFPAHVPYPGGSVFFSPLISWLPGKQPSADEFLKSALNLNFQGFGLAMGATGGFYMDFGPLGVAIGFSVLGLISALIWRKAQQTSGWLIAYAFLVSHLWIINYSHPLPYLTTLLVPLAASFCVEKERFRLLDGRLGLQPSLLVKRLV